VHLFEFHTGFKPEQHGNQFVTDCPFCEKEKHFFYNQENGLWDCKVCLKSGNPITFLRELYNQFDNLTKTSHFIANLRDLPISCVQKSGLKYNEYNGTYLIPTFKNGKLNNLYKVALVKKQDKTTHEWYEKWIIMVSPGMEHTLMNWDETTEDTIWVTEGHWDRLAADAIIASNGITPIGVPGAGVWKGAWCEALSEKHVVFCYDNDTSGRAGFEQVIIKHISASQYKPKSISFLDWPSDKPEKYDLNDCYREYGRGAFGKIKEWIKPYTSPENIVVVKNTIETIEADRTCTDYDELVRRYESVYHTTNPMKLGLLLVLSSIYSTRVEGEQLWVRLFGAPSSGKTTIAKVVSGSSQVVLKSTFTGLFSGWKDEKGNTDASLIPLIAGKTLIVKDADALMKQTNVQQIFSELRDFYDKDSSTFYKNMVSHDYRNIRSTMILCGTHVLRRSDQSFLGERFLDFELDLSERDRELIEDRMLQRSMTSAINPSTLPPEMPVVAAAKGFIELLMDKPCNTQLDAQHQQNIKIWARLAATLRTKVDRETFGQREIASEPVVEVAARLIGQLTKLYMCAPVVLGIDRPNQLVDEIVTKVVRDIIDYKSPRMKICRHIMKAAHSRDELVERTDLPIERVNRELQDLMALRLLYGEQSSSTSGLGRKVLKVRLHPDITKSLQHIGFE
jgi:hypothetical protein